MPDEEPVNNPTGTYDDISSSEETKLEERTNLDNLDDEKIVFELQNDAIEMDIGQRALSIMVVSIHLACALSRPALEVSDDPVIKFVSAASWIIYSIFITGLIFILNRRLGVLVNSDFIVVPAISLAWIIVIGSILAFVGWINGISDPIQWWSTGYLSLFISFILFARYTTRRRRNSISLTLSRPSFTVIFASIIVLVASICGPLIMNYQNQNLWSMGALALVAILPVITKRGGVFGDYLLLYSLSLSLLLMHSLVSAELVGTDVHTEFMFANNVVETGMLDISGSHRYSTVLSTQLILPTLSMWTGLSVVETMKITYPIIYSFTPVLLYFSYSNAFSRDVSFYSTLITIFCFAYYISMLNVVRQGFAEVFLLSAIALLSSSDSMRMYRLRIFIIPFLIMMTVSHYSINYILYPLLWTSLLAMRTLSFFRPVDGDDVENFAYQRGMDNLPGEDGAEELDYFQFYDDILLDEEGILTLEELQTLVIRTNPLLNFPQLAAGTIFVFAWHLASGGGVVLDSITAIISESREMISDRGILGSITSTQATETVTTTLEPLHELTKLSFIFLSLLSIYGLYSTFMEERISRPKRSFLTLALGSIVLFIPFFIVPFLALRLEFQRIFHWLFMFLAPFSVMGLFWLSNVIYPGNDDEKNSSENAMTFSMVILSLFLLLNSGFLYQLTDERHRMVFDPEMAFFRLDDAEIRGADWMDENLEFETSRPCVWADVYNSFYFSRHWGEYTIFNSPDGAGQSEFLFLGDENIRDQGFYLRYRIGTEFYQDSFTDFSEMPIEFNTLKYSEVYDSGDSIWAYSPNGCKIPGSYLG